MIAERLELWRLSNFALRRLASAEDVYLFHAVARPNPQDERLIALAEVRDLTPARDSSGAIIGYPHMEGMLAQALAGIRRALRGRPPRQRPLSNRVVLYVRPALGHSHRRPGADSPTGWRRSRPTSGWRRSSSGSAGRLERPASRATAVLDVENVEDGRWRCGSGRRLTSRSSP